MMLHTIKKVEWLEEYKLKLHFNDKSVKMVDLAAMLKKAKNMFLPLVNIDYFKKVECDGTTICWPNGVDLCPDFLFQMGKSITQPNRKLRKASRARRRKSLI
jgi:hypothetical protein